jgi:hypothetical protein
VARAAEVVAAHYTAEAMCRRWGQHLESIVRPAEQCQCD